MKLSRSQICAIVGAVLLIVACFLPWVHIDDPSITLTGVDTTGTRYGVPAYNHFVFALLILVCSFIPIIWVKRVNPLFGALNLAWAFRNFVVIPACDGGVCPVKLSGIYLVLLASVILLLTTLFPKAPPVKEENDTTLNNQS